MAQAEQERQAFRNYYETNDEQWDEMERERMMFPFDPQAQEQGSWTKNQSWIVTILITMSMTVGDMLSIMSSMRKGIGFMVMIVRSVGSSYKVDNDSRALVMSAL